MRICRRSNTPTEPITTPQIKRKKDQAFDSIPHHELMKCVARRISDRHLLHLIKMWLEAPVEETDESGRKQRTTRNKDEGRGTPQGGVLSPLLANLYMRRFVLGWKVGGHEERLDAHIVNYADDFVICCRPRVADGGNDGDAGDDGAAAAHGEREEDAPVCPAERDVYLLGVHVWPTSLLENGPCVRSTGTGQEKGAGDLSKDQCGDESANDVA